MNVSFDLNGVASSSFEDCPFCGCKLTFGVLPVFGRSYTRKCGICRKSKHFDLPPLSKKVIYLDQFALSNMMKEIDSSRAGKQSQPHGDFFLELFKQLDRLGKLQLIVCPRSSIHFNESIVDHNDYRKIRAVYDLLSRGFKFDHHQNVYTQQILNGLHAWLKGKASFETNLDPAKVMTDGAITEWDDWFRISANWPVSEEALANELRTGKALLEGGLKPVIARWQQQPDKRFDDWYAEEIAANGEALIRCWCEYAQTATAVCAGKLPADSFPNLNYAVRLVSEILLRLEAAGVQSAERFPKAREFFASSIFRQIPIVSIGAAMWAGLAHRLNNGQKKWKVSMADDITAISTHLPFCDVMFLEKECANLLASEPVKKHITYKTQVFSLKNKDEFLAYLKEIETSATKEHLEKIQELYGKFWAMPFSKLQPSNQPT
ncbi:MAG: hypothetical protein WDM80_05505 [Limisphaerales bacterium]